VPHSRLTTTFALFLALAYALTGFCVAAPVATTAHQVPAAPCSGCHGHHQHVPAAPRYCCVNPQAPAALQASASPAPLRLAGYQADELVNRPESVIAISPELIAFSPPPPAVLRI